MNRNSKKKSKLTIFDIFIIFFILFSIAIFLSHKKDKYENESRTYTQKTIDSLVIIIKECKGENESYYNRIIQLQENLDTLKNSLYDVQGTITKLKTQKNEKPISTDVVIHGEIPKFLPNRYK